MVKCKICGKEFEYVNYTHLRTHNITPNEYKEKYPNAKTRSDEMEKRRSNSLKNRTMSEEAKKKISEKNKGNEPWNKGLTKEDHPGIRSQARKVSEIVEGRKHSAESKKKMSKRQKETYENGREPWNKGLTRETDERVEKQAKQMEGDKNTMCTNPKAKEKMVETLTGRTLSKEHCREMSKAQKDRDPEINEKISETMKNRKFTEEHRKHLSEASKGSKPTYPKPYYVEELGHNVRSTWEEIIGLILQKSNIDYEYEGRTFKFNGGIGYTPDYLLSSEFILEVKGWMSEFWYKKYKEFKSSFPDVFFMMVVGDDNNKYGEEVADKTISWKNRDKLPELIKELSGGEK